MRWPAAANNPCSHSQVGLEDITVKRKNTFKPVCAYDRMGYIRLLRIVAELDGDILRLVYRDTTKEHIQTCEIGVAQLAEDSMARYATSTANPVTEANNLKRLAMDYGATPEAIRLLGTLVSLSKQEEATMAEKLKAKGGKAADTKASTKGDAEALKGAAKTAPVAKGKKVETEAPKKRGGNPEALAKAREAGGAAREERNKQKITVLDKNHGARDGSNRANMLNIVLRSKTVGAALEAGAGWLDVKFAADKGFIELK